MNTQVPFIVMSASLEGLDNTQRTKAMADMLERKGYSFVPVNGVYKGVSEDSFLVTLAPNAPGCADLLRLAQAYGQESVLYVDANRYATLITLDPKQHKGLGMWREVADVAQYDAYTQSKEGRYYVAG